MQSQPPGLEQSANDSNDVRLPSYARPTIASMSTLMKRSFKVSKPPSRQVSKSTSSYQLGSRRSTKRPRSVTTGHLPVARTSVPDPHRSLSILARARTSLLESIGVKPHNDQKTIQRASQKQISGLEAEVARLIQDRHHLLAKIEQGNTDSVARESLEQSQIRVRELEDFQQLTLSRTAEFQQMLQDIQEEKESFDAVTSDLRQQLNDIAADHKVEAASLTQELDAANYKAGALQSVVNELQCQVDGHKAVGEKLEQLNTALALANAAHSNELERCRVLESKLSESNQQILESQLKTLLLETQISECHLKVLNLESELLAAQATVASLRQNSSADVQELKTKLNDALSVASSAEEMIATLILEKEQFHRDSLDAQTLLMVANDKIAALDRERSDAIEESAVAKANADSAIAHAQELKDLAKLYEQTIESLRAAIEANRALDDHASQAIKDLEASLAKERETARKHVQYLHQYNDVMHKLSETEKTLKTVSEGYEAQLVAARENTETQVSLARAAAESQVSLAHAEADLNEQRVRQAEQDDFWLAKSGSNTDQGSENVSDRISPPTDSQSAFLPKHLSKPLASGSLIKDVVSMTNVPCLGMSPEIFSDHNPEKDTSTLSSPSRTPSADKTPKHILANSKAENYKLMVSSMTKEKKHKKKSPHKSPNKVHKSKSLLRAA